MGRSPMHGHKKKPPAYKPKVRKRCLSPTADPPDYDAEELEFIKAMDKFKREKKPFPTWSEVLGVLKELGWRKIG